MDGWIITLHATSRHHSFDLDLPESFVPYNGDGEVEAFTLMPLNEAIESIEKELYKCACLPASVSACACVCGVKGRAHVIMWTMRARLSCSRVWSGSTGCTPYHPPTHPRPITTGKPNAALTVLDFAVRHGEVDSDRCDDHYIEVRNGVGCAVLCCGVTWCVWRRDSDSE